MSLNVETSEAFLERMRGITEGVSDLEKRPSPPVANKNKETICRNCGKKGDAHKECKSDPTCFYCKTKGHRQFECPTLQKKEPSSSNSRHTNFARPASTAMVAALSATEGQGSSVAVVQDPDGRLEISDPFVQISSVMGERANLTDTGSHVSFIRYDIFLKYVKPYNGKLSPTNRCLKNLNDQPIRILGISNAKVALKQMKENEFEINFYVLLEDTFTGDIIIGREFLMKENLTLVYKPRSEIGERVSLFTFLPLSIGEESDEEPIEEMLGQIEIDFEPRHKKSLESLLLSVHRGERQTVQDDYRVRVNMKDKSVYAYAPRRFAHVERVQI